MVVWLNQNKKLSIQLQKKTLYNLKKDMKKY
ncbi:hypothetical protein LCGC14_1091920 [marine sediment metagenome]|uniref:Uncharacterized protein n=1 Tax=marine sediment metagenome TaxID=412755 RepID=A0A0F9QI54_9ZZZZ